MERLNTGDPCPCCGQPIKLTDPSALEMLKRICEMVGLPDLRKPAPILTPGKMVVPEKR